MTLEEFAKQEISEIVKNVHVSRIVLENNPTAPLVWEIHLNIPENENGIRLFMDHIFPSDNTIIYKKL